MTDGLLAAGDNVLVAFSGGPDSSALLAALVAVSARAGIGIRAAHFDHGLRPDSGDDASSARTLCEKLGVPLNQGHGDVARRAKEEGTSIEDAARIARYEFLVAIAERTGCNVVATGHTSDDQAETVMMRLLRGTGLRGLLGIPRSRPLTHDIRVVRPLLFATRAEIISYCAAKQIKYIDDPSNLDPVHMRNRLRLGLMPLMDRLSQGWKERLLHTLEILGAENDYMDRVAKQELAGISQAPEDSVVIDLTALGTLHPAIQRRVVRLAAVRAAQEAGVDGRLTRERVLALLERAERPGGFVLELGAGLEAHREYDTLAIRSSAQASGHDITHAAPIAASADIFCVLQNPGRLELGHGTSISAQLVDAPGHSELGAHPYRVFLSPNSAAFPMVIRNVRPGDRMVPFGMEGSKKLHDILIDDKVPQPMRARALVVEYGGRIAWLVGHRLSEEFKLLPGELRALEVAVDAR